MVLLATLLSVGAQGLQRVLELVNAKSGLLLITLVASHCFLHR